jgi:hypothetical protein
MSKTEERIFDPNHHYFPEFDDPSIVAFLIPFGRLMFGYAKLDREIARLVGVAANNPVLEDKFRRADADKVSEQVEKTIRKHVGVIAEMQAIKDQLDLSAKLYDLRNVLAHGHWWRFDPSSETITIRRDRDHDVRFVDVTRIEIEQAAEQFEDIEVEIYKIRRAIEARQIETAGIVR